MQPFYDLVRISNSSRLRCLASEFALKRIFKDCGSGFITMISLRLSHGFCNRELLQMNAMLMLV